MNPTYQNIYNNLILYLEEQFNQWYLEEADHLDKDLFLIDIAINAVKTGYELNSVGCANLVKNRDKWITCVFDSVTDMIKIINEKKPTGVTAFNIEYKKINQFYINNFI